MNLCNTYRLRCNAAVERRQAVMRNAEASKTYKHDITMIVLPAKKILIRKRAALYDKLHCIAQHTSVSQVEDIMRNIHRINMRLKTYFNRQNEPVKDL